MSRNKLLFVVFLLLIPNLTFAQTYKAEVQWEHDGVMTTGYKVYMDDVVITSVPNDSAICSSTIPRICRASIQITNSKHVFIVSAYNALGEAKANPYNFEGLMLPPTNTTITIKLTAEVVIK